MKWYLSSYWYNWKKRRKRKKILSYNRKPVGDFPGVPVVKILCFQCRGCGFDPWLGTMIPHGAWHGQRAKKKGMKKKKESQ